MKHENSSKHSGKIRAKFEAKFGTKFEKFGELSFCNFSDLTTWFSFFGESGLVVHLHRRTSVSLTHAFASL